VDQAGADSLAFGEGRTYTAMSRRHHLNEGRAKLNSSSRSHAPRALNERRIMFGEPEMKNKMTNRMVPG
jgi:hypothetical protein